MIEVGMRFGRWTVIEDLGQQPVGRQGQTCHKVRVKCECGTERVIQANSLKNGSSTQCKECSTITHGFYAGIPKTKEGLALKRAIERCYDSNNPSYMSHGGRGIIVADDWLGEGGYERFLEHVGPCPPNKTELDRYPNNATGSYVPFNVRWATHKENCRNRRNNVLITIDGITLYQTDWAKISGAFDGTISKRIKRGWTPIEAVFCKPRCKALPSDTHLKLAFLKAAPQA